MVGRLSPSSRQILEPQGKLNRGRTANLVKRIEAASDSSRPQTTSQRLRGLSEEGVRDISECWIAEVGVVEDIEEFGAKLETRPFREMKLSNNRKVRLPRAETAEHIAPKVTLL